MSKCTVVPPTAPPTYVLELTAEEARYVKALAGSALAGVQLPAIGRAYDKEADGEPFDSVYDALNAVGVPDPARAGDINFSARVR